jgi:hypothetical protein
MWKTKYILQGISPTLLWISVKLYPYHCWPMRCRWYKIGCNCSKTKGTLLEEQSTFSTSLFIFHGAFWNSTPITLCAFAAKLWLRLFNNEGHFTWRSKKFLHCISPSIPRIFLKLHTFHSLHMLYNWYKFGCNRSIKKGTLLEEQILSPLHLVFYSIDLSETP